MLRAPESTICARTPVEACAELDAVGGRDGHELRERGERASGRPERLRWGSHIFGSRRGHYRKARGLLFGGRSREQCESGGQTGQRQARAERSNSSLLEK